MAAPTPTARQAPAGKRLGEGHKCVICPASDANVELWELDITPPGYQVGPAVDTTTQHSLTHQKSPPTIVETTDASGTVAYDPVAYQSVKALMGVVMVWTWHFPDHSSYCAWAYLSEWKPGALKRGDMPTAGITIVITDTDPSDCSYSAGVYTAGTGTGAC